jgi:hypothetical protein
MKSVAIIIALSIVALAGLGCNRFKSASTVASTSQPEAIRYVDDAANVIDESSRQELAATLAALKERKKIDFSVVTVVSTGDKSAFDYSLTLARERKSNRSDKTVIAGLLLLVAVDDRKWHIQISNNLEDDLTDEILTTLSEPMTDSFRRKRRLICPVTTTFDLSRPGTRISETRIACLAQIGLTDETLESLYLRQHRSSGDADGIYLHSGVQDPRLHGGGDRNRRLPPLL